MKLRAFALGICVFSAVTFLSSCDSQTAGVSGANSSVNNSSGAVTTGSTGSDSSTATSDALTGTAALDTEEASFFHLINDYRVQNGLAALQLSVTLTKSSDWMSTDMAAHNNFSHTDTLGRDPSARMAAFGYDTSSWWGENIAAGNATAQDTFTQWKNSPAHNANMLGANFKVIGIARAQGASSTYGWYWTTDFGGTVDETVAVP
jgi:uncharacterized protein YkwD